VRWGGKRLKYEAKRRIIFYFKKHSHVEERTGEERNKKSDTNHVNRKILTVKSGNHYNLLSKGEKSCLIGEDT